MVLAAALFRVAMPRLAAALAPQKPAPGTKERLFAALEEGAWALPADALADYGGDESWAEAALDKPVVKVLLEQALQRAAASQPR